MPLGKILLNNEEENKLGMEDSGEYEDFPQVRLNTLTGVSLRSGLVSHFQKCITLGVLLLIIWVKMNILYFIILNMKYFSMYNFFPGNLNLF